MVKKYVVQKEIRLKNKVYQYLDNGINIRNKNYIKFCRYHLI